MPTAAKKPSATLTIGSTAPAFDLPADNGKTISLASFAGKKNVVLYFYPKDDTPGCTIEAKDFRDLAKDFATTDTVIIGLSKDSIASHCKFRDKYDLNFTLASDEDGAICAAYGAWGEKSMYGKKYMGIVRGTFLIDKAGKIAASWPKVSVTDHANAVLKEAKKLA